MRILTPLALSVCWLFSWLACPSTAASAEGGQPSESAEAIRIGPQDWPWWRGPTSDGVAPAGQSPPHQWSRDKNVLWRAPLPGRGHASPTVVGARVYIPTADEQADVQSVLAFDRDTGRQVWKTDVHTGKLDRKGNKKTSQASSSIACDGQRLYVNFLNDNAVYTTALDLDGKQIWQTKVSPFSTHQGFGSSPALYQSLVLVTSDSPAGGTIAALDRATGRIVWSRDRPRKANYASPVVHHIDGQDQLLVSGCDLVTALDPLTGRKLWEIDGATTECVTTIVTDGRHVFVSGGYPRQHTQAVVADGSGKTAWQNRDKVYVPSMIVREGYLYAVQDGGVAVCWKADTGKEMWKARLGGTFTASLVLVGDELWATNEAGETFIYQATPEKYELTSKNQLGDQVYATPVVCGGRVFHRVVESDGGRRQEVLYCLGEK